MKKYLYTIIIIAFTMLTSCNDYLNKKYYGFEDDTFWISEDNLRAYSMGFYPYFFPGYAQDYVNFGGFFSGGSFSDDFLMAKERSSKFYFPVDKTAASGAWSTFYTYVRKANVMIDKIPTMPITEEAKDHWLAVGRLFRAMTYASLVQQYGDVPYIDIPVSADDHETLFKPRNPRLEVVQHILDDYQFAIENIRDNDGQLQANKYVAAAMMSRDLLYHGTWLTYHGTTVGPSSQPVPQSELKAIYDGCIKASEIIMNSDKYQIGNEYNMLFSSPNLKDNKEVIFYREYVENKLMNALMSYNAGLDQEQGGVTLDFVNSYLCADGLPIGQSPLYEGKTNPSVPNIMKNRDPRIYQTLADTLRVMNGGIQEATSPTGFATLKFLNQEWFASNSVFTTGRNSIANAPNLRYSETLLNYIEARYEISKIGGGALNQSDFDKTINQIRSRELVKWGETEPKPKLPPVTLSGNSLAVNGTVINDPDIDPTVDPILWEIRRERRVELAMEGLRTHDLNRWAKFEYLNTATNGKPNNTILGAYIVVSDYPDIKIADGTKTGVNLYNDGGNNLEAGYVYYYPLEKDPARVFDNSTYRYYLKAVPITQIALYERNGYTLTQNPGWD